MSSAFFLNPAMLLGGLLVAVPIAIHLIHRFRYRQVRWAAMDFLLEGSQATRRRILLEQLLLLILRCLIVLGIVLIIARPLASESVAGLFAAGDRSHHWIVLDDSYSMAEQSGSADCFSDAAGVVENLIQGLAEQPGNHGVTLIRTSSDSPDLLASKLDEVTLLKSRELLSKASASYLSTPPAKGILVAADQIEASDAGRKSIHFLSDFRVKDWPREGEIPRTLLRLSDNGVAIQLVDAAPATGINLGIERAVARTGSAAVGVPFEVDVSIRNHSSQAVTEIPLSAVVDGRLLPTRSIERIEPNALASTTISLELAEPGPYQVSIALPEDALTRDNTAYLSIDLPERLPVLLIDGSKDRVDSTFLSLALAPGGSVRTGLAPVVQGPEYLAGGSLEGFHVLFLLNVSRLEKPAIDALERFVRGGRGLAIFLGDQVAAEDYNARMFGEGKDASLMPARLGAVKELPLAQGEEEAELLLEKHPIFRVFEGERNPFLQTVRVSKLFQTLAKAANPPVGEVIGRVRGGAPLVIDATLGNGRIVTFLTSAGPEWNNWAKNPSYVVAMLELYSYLARPVIPVSEPRVGDPWRIEFPASEFRGDLVVAIPNPIDGASEDLSADAELDGLVYRYNLADSRFPGIYAIQRTRSDGSTQWTRRAYNVDPGEGALAKLARSELEQRLVGVKYSYATVRDLKANLEGEGFEPRDWLLLAFLITLIAEQIWSGRISYPLK